MGRNAHFDSGEHPAMQVWSPLDVYFLVNRFSTSWYLAVVFASTSAGSFGAGCFLFHGWVSSQLRTICLSNDGGLIPVRYSAAGQKRDESGVRISSIR